MWVATYFFLLSIMDALTQASVSAFYESVLGKTYCGLFIAPTPAPTPGLLMSGITEANYDGYARQPLVWFAPFLDSAGPADAAAQNLHFSPSDANVPNTITGAFVASALTGGQLLLAAAFATPVALTSPLLALNLAPVFQLPFTVNYGGPFPFS
jgi:hypothetical protein